MQYFMLINNFTISYCIIYLHIRVMFTNNFTISYCINLTICDRVKHHCVQKDNCFEINRYRTEFSDVENRFRQRSTLHHSFPSAILSLECSLNGHDVTDTWRNNNRFPRRMYRSVSLVPLFHRHLSTASDIEQT